jgi:hypothetical protein
MFRQASEILAETLSVLEPSDTSFVGKAPALDDEHGFSQVVVGRPKVEMRVLG